MSSHINSVCKSSFYHLKNIRYVRKYLCKSSAECLIHSFVSSRLDYCNSVMYGVPSRYLSKLQLVQNSAARVVTCIKRQEHISPILYSLHWLPISFRIQFKILLLTFKALHGLAPSYLSELIVPYVSSREGLRSSNKNLLKIPKSKLVSCGDKSFTVAAPKLWNSLPLELRSMSSVTAFKSNLKTYLFRKAFSAKI